MFECGLFATFIPEVLMVIGFVLCILTPAFNTNNSTVEQAPIVAHISTFERQETGTYIVSVCDFQADEFIPQKNSSIPYFINKLIFNRLEYCFSTSDGLTFVDFSRPPPTFLS